MRSSSTAPSRRAKFAVAARNLPEIDVLPVQGVDVYDIMRREKLVLTRAAVQALEGAVQMIKDVRHYDAIVAP